MEYCKWVDSKCLSQTTSFRDYLYAIDQSRLLSDWACKWSILRMEAFSKLIHFDGFSPCRSDSAGNLLIRQPTFPYVRRLKRIGKSVQRNNIPTSNEGLSSKRPLTPQKPGNYVLDCNSNSTNLRRYHSCKRHSWPNIPIPLK